MQNELRPAASRWRMAFVIAMFLVRLLITINTQIVNYFILYYIVNCNVALYIYIDKIFQTDTNSIHFNRYLLLASISGIVFDIIKLLLRTSLNIIYGILENIEFLNKSTYSLIIIDRKRLFVLLVHAYVPISGYLYMHMYQ